MPNPEYLAELDRRYRARLEAATEELRRSFEQRLRAATDGLASALAEARTAPAEKLIDPADFEPIESSARQEGERSAFDALLETTLAFDLARTQGALLDALLDGARRFAPRAALLIADRDGARGWGSIGYGPDAERFPGRPVAWSGEALSAFAAGEGVVRAQGAAAGELADTLALPAASESLLVPLVLRDRVAAALYADRRGDEAELPVAALQIVACAAAQRLELQAFATRSYTPTLYEAGAVSEPGLPLWDPSALGGAEEVPAAESAPAGEPAQAWADEAAGALFELAPESAELEPEPAPAEPPAPALEPISKSGIEELFEAEPAAPAAGPSWSGAEAVSWARPTPAVPASAEPASWSAADAVSWAAPAPEPAPAEPAAAPAEPEWEMEPAEGDATVLVSRTPEPPAPAPAPGPETTAPFAPPAAAETRAFSFALETPRGAATHEIALPAETTAPIPVFAEPPAATVAVPTVSMPITPDLTEDATLLVSRPALVVPPAPPAPITPPPPAEPVEDQTHPSLRTPGAGAEEDANDRTAARAGARGTEVAPPPDLQGPGLAFTMSRTQRASGESALHEEARRLARLLVSEIKLYNEEQVEEGRRHRDLYLRLKEDIDRSRQIYDERVHDSVRGTTDYFQQELIRSLAGGDPRALGM